MSRDDECTDALESSTEDEIWPVFLRSDFAVGATPAQLARVKSRHPLQSRPPSMALYQGLLLHHQQALSLDELATTLDSIEALDRAVDAEHRRARFRLVKDPRPSRGSRSG